MEGDFWKFAITALGSGGVVATLLKVIGPALKLNAASNDASARAIAQWKELYDQQKAELDKAREDEAKAEGRAQKAERKTAALEAELRQARDRISKLEGNSP